MASLGEKWPILKEWKFLFAVTWPLALLPILIMGTSVTTNCAYAVALLAGFWMTEAIPIPVTSLMPMFLYPILGVQSSDVLAHEYLKDSIQIFVGGLFIALAFEYCGLHKRVALRVILFTGTSVKMLMMGIMLCTMVLSMWMSNTAVAAMMVPIILAVLEELQKSLNQVYKQPDNQNEQCKGIMNDAFDMELTGTETTTTTTTTVNTVVPINNLENSRSSLVVPSIESCDLEHHRCSDTPRPSIVSRKKSIPYADLLGVDDTKEIDEEMRKTDKLSVYVRNIRTMFLLSCAYASNIGGTAVVTGSGTNLVAMEFLGNLDPKHHGDYAALTFTTWLAFNILPMLLNIIIAWVYLQFSFIGIPIIERLKFWNRSHRDNGVSSTIDKKKDDALFITPNIEIKIKDMLQQSYNDLGPVTAHEKGVAVCFLLAVTSWILHDPKFIPGWSQLFTQKVSISTAALGVSALFFMIPRNQEFYDAFSKRDFTGVKFKPLLEWNFVQKKFPWGVVVLLGGGYAMSNGAKKSGLSAWVGQSLISLASLPPYGILAVVCVMIGFLTEIASNTATATIVLPILLELSKELNIHPLYLTLPATVTCSYAFMLPVATPPNAIVYAASDMEVTDMIKTGFFMNCSCLFVLYVTTNLYGNLIFHFSDYNYIP